MSGITFIRSDTGQQRVVDKPQITIGSASACDVQLNHPSVQPEHATVRVRSGEVSIIGVDPDFTLDVNSMPVIGVRNLESGASIRVGKLFLEVRWAESIAEEATQKTLSSESVMQAAEEKTEALRMEASGIASPPSTETESVPAALRRKASEATSPPSTGTESGPEGLRKGSRLESSPSKGTDGETDSGQVLEPVALPTNAAREAATQLMSAFEAIEKAKKIEQQRLAEAKTQMLDQGAVLEAESKEHDVRTDETRSEEPRPEESESSPLQIGSASEGATAGLDQRQIDAIYKLYERHRAHRKEAGEGESTDSGEAALSLTQILEMGPQAFGVKSWEEVASEAAAEPEVEDDPWAGLALLRDVHSDNVLPRILVVTTIALMATLLVLFWMIPAEPVQLDEERPLEEIPVGELERIEHEDDVVRCFNEGECRELARRELEVAKSEWENRDSTYENRFKAFEHADRARMLLERSELEMSELEGLEPVWTEARDEVDEVFESLRVSFFVAMSRKNYERALDVLRLTQAYFPSQRSREHRWAQQLILTFKEQGIETKIQHRRATIGRWN